MKIHNLIVLQNTTTKKKYHLYAITGRKNKRAILMELNTEPLIEGMPITPSITLNISEQEYLSDYVELRVRNR